jgi:hypothetical protein
VVRKSPRRVRPVDVLAFMTAQRTGGDGRLQIAGAGGGVSARTLRRLSSVSGLYGFLHVRGNVMVNPVPRGLPTRRERQRPGQGVPLVRVPRTQRLWRPPPRRGPETGDAALHPAQLGCYQDEQSGGPCCQGEAPQRLGGATRRRIADARGVCASGRIPSMVRGQSSVATARIAADMRAIVIAGASSGPGRRLNILDAAGFSRLQRWGLVSTGECNRQVRDLIISGRRSPDLHKQRSATRGKWHGRSECPVSPVVGSRSIALTGCDQGVSALRTSTSAIAACRSWRSCGSPAGYACVAL